MNTLDLLNEISNSPLSKRTDAQLLGRESATKKNIVWTKEKFLPIWEDVEQNRLKQTEMAKKYGMHARTYIMLCKRHNLTRNPRPRSTTESVDTRSQNIVNKPINQDIINGMSRKEWSIKWARNGHNFDNRRQRLRKKGLVD